MTSVRSLLREKGIMSRAYTILTEFQIYFVFAFCVCKKFEKNRPPLGLVQCLIFQTKIWYCTVQIDFGTSTTTELLSETFLFIFFILINEGAGCYSPSSYEQKTLSKSKAEAHSHAKGPPTGAILFHNFFETDL